jgi:hypothetical protein
VARIDSVARIDPEPNRIAGRSVRTGAGPQSLAVGGGWLWVANYKAGTVTRIEQASGKFVADIPVPSEPHRVAYGAGAVWVGNWHGISVSRIDPETNRVVGSPIPIGFRAGNLVVGTGGVWVTSDDRVDAAPRGRGGCAHRPADQPSGRDDRRRWSPDRCRGNQGRRLGVGRRPRRGATDCRALTRLPDLVVFRSQAATMSWVVQMGRQEWAGCKCGRRDRLQPIRGYERNVWPPRTRRAGQSIARSAPLSAAAPFP